MEFNDELILIDGNSLINRAYYALPMLTSEKGEPCGAVYGFANMLVRIPPEVRGGGFRHARADFPAQDVRRL